MSHLESVLDPGASLPRPPQFEPSARPAAARSGIARAERPTTEQPATAPGRIWLSGLLAALAWSALALLTQAWPNAPVGFSDWAYTEEFAWLAWGIAGALALLALLPGPLSPLRERLRSTGPWLVTVALGLALWELFTAKTASLPAPFFAPPQSLIEVFVSDWPRLLDSAYNSIKLLLVGIFIGAVLGFAP